jgi:hypothetical protein
MRAPRCLSVCAVAGVAASAAGCAAPVPSLGAKTPDIVIDCATSDIHHTFRISPSDGTVDDLSFAPAKRGVAEVSDRDYRLSFHERRDNYDLILLIDRASGKGTRQLFDDEQQSIKGQGGTDDIACTLQPQ